MNLIPLLSRLIPIRERRLLNGLSALIGESDRIFVCDVSHSLFVDGFDVFIGGEIVENAYTNSTKLYPRIELFAFNGIESIRKHVVNRLTYYQKESGSEQWAHFGIITQRLVGWEIKDIHHGNKFYCTPISLGDEISEFKLEPAVYDSLKKPVPIYISFISSLSNYEIKT